MPIVLELAKTNAIITLKIIMHDMTMGAIIILVLSVGTSLRTPHTVLPSTLMTRKFLKTSALSLQNKYAKPPME